jgi:hypothetical protein
MSSTEITHEQLLEEASMRVAAFLQDIDRRNGIMIALQETGRTVMQDTPANVGRIAVGAPLNLL